MDYEVRAPSLRRIAAGSTQADQQRAQALRHPGRDEQAEGQTGRRQAQPTLRARLSARSAAALRPSSCRAGIGVSRGGAGPEGPEQRLVLLAALGADRQVVLDSRQPIGDRLPRQLALGEFRDVGQAFVAVDLLVPGAADQLEQIFDFPG